MLSGPKTGYLASLPQLPPRSPANVSDAVSARPVWSSTAAVWPPVGTRTAPTPRQSASSGYILVAVTSTKLAPLLSRYAQRVHERAGNVHHVASPLGAWLLVALCAPLAKGPQRCELSEVLGTEPEEAAALAAGLAAEPHPVVGSGVAVWSGPELDTDELAAWKADLPASVETGKIPEQATLDAWTKARTLGLIDHFPLERDPADLLVMATALATRVSWARAFDLVPASALGSSSLWTPRLRQALHAPAGDSRHPAFIADTDAAGTVAVHTGLARSGLQVTSVIAGPDVATADVLGAAHDIAIAEAVRPGTVARRSLFDLPLGEGPLWTITEERANTTSPDGREQRYGAVLPAWSARSNHNLNDPALGYPATAAALAETLHLGEYRYRAQQTAMARYTRLGFEAAAVTAHAMASSMPRRRIGTRRIAELRFAHPFAVVAVTIGDQHARAREHAKGRAWHGLPVFSAWVMEPDEAE